MSDALGPITLGKKHDQVFLGRDLARDRDYSEEIAKAIDQEIRKTIDDCYQKAQDILEQEYSKLEVIAQTLLDKETLDAEEIKALVEGRELPEKKEIADVKEDELPDNAPPDSVIPDHSDSPEPDVGRVIADSGKRKKEVAEEKATKVAEEKSERRASFQQRTEQKEKPKEDH